MEADKTHDMIVGDKGPQKGQVGGSRNMGKEEKQMICVKML